MVIEHQRCEGSMHCSSTSGSDIDSNVLHLPATVTFPDGTDMSCSQVNETLLYKWTLSCNIDTGPPQSASADISLFLGIILFLSLVLNGYLIYRIRYKKQTDAPRTELDALLTDNTQQKTTIIKSTATIPLKESELQEVAGDK